MKTKSGQPACGKKKNQGAQFSLKITKRRCQLIPPNLFWSAPPAHLLHNSQHQAPCADQRRPSGVQECLTRVACSQGPVHEDGFLSKPENIKPGRPSVYTKPSFSLEPHGQKLHIFKNVCECTLVGLFEQMKQIFIFAKADATALRPHPLAPRHAT